MAELKANSTDDVVVPDDTNDDGMGDVIES
jgi:hypothetical protein